MEKTKIDIISGFLGAGKTTLIKKLLKDAFKGEQVVLIENEFGEIGIDGGFLKESGIEIKIPAELCNSDDAVEFIHSATGGLSLLIKDVLV